MARNKGKGEGFMMLKHRLMDSAAYVKLSLTARALLTEMVRVATPERNGQLVFPMEYAEKRLGVCANTLRPAFVQLEAHGFIVITGLFRYTDGKAYEYRVTCQPVGRKLPTNEWERWTEEAPFPVNRRGGGKK